MTSPAFRAVAAPVRDVDAAPLAPAFAGRLDFARSELRTGSVFCGQTAVPMNSGPTKRHDHRVVRRSDRPPTLTDPLGQGLVYQ